MSEYTPSGPSLEPQEDLVHPAQPHAVWRESYHFGFGDPATGRFGYATFGKRPVKRRSGFLIAYWDPEHGLLVGQEIDTFQQHDNQHDVAGLKASCVTSFEQWRVSYEGSLVRVPRIGERRHEEARAIPQESRELVPVAFDFTWRALSPAHAYAWDPTFRALFDGRHEQPGRCDGELTVDGATTQMSGWSGIRDHAWGARDWFGPARWRWVAATFEIAPHLSLLFTTLPDGTTVVGGAVYDERGAVPIVEYTEHVVEVPSPGKAEAATAEFTVRDADGRTLEVRGAVSAMLPIRFSPPDSPRTVSWNDRSIMRFEANHGMGIGEMEFMALVEDESDEEGQR